MENENGVYNSLVSVCPDCSDDSFNGSFGHEFVKFVNNSDYKKAYKPWIIVMRCTKCGLKYWFHSDNSYKNIMEIIIEKNSKKQKIFSTI